MQRLGILGAVLALSLVAAPTAFAAGPDVSGPGRPAPVAVPQSDPQRAVAGEATQGLPFTAYDVLLVAGCGLLLAGLGRGLNMAVRRHARPAPIVARPALRVVPDEERRAA